MMRYVTRDEMRELDRKAIDSGTPAEILMERAGEALAKNAAKLLKLKRSIWIFSGYGNNGGDGFAAARYLNEMGYRVTLFLTGAPKELSPESAYHYGRIPAGDVITYRIECDEDLSVIKDERPSLIIDAIFGIGFHGELSGFYKNLIATINLKKAVIISADIPSGLDADTGEALPFAVNADRTVTFGYPKAGFKSDAAKKYLGDLVVADIGI